MTDRWEDVTAYLQGELPPERASELERRAAADPALRARIEANRRVLAGLAAMDDAEWNDARVARPARWRGVAAAAAALLLAFVLVDAWDPAAPMPVSPHAPPAHVADLARLLRRPDVDALAGRELGLRSVGVVALARSSDGAMQDDLTASVAWLLGHQQDDGTILRAHGASEHAVATVALLEASRHVDVPTEALERAVEALRRQARRAPPPGTPTVHEAWTLQALLLARDLGHGSCDLAIAAVHRSLRIQAPGDVGPEPSLADARRLCVPRTAADDELLSASRRVLAAVSL